MSHYRVTLVKKSRAGTEVLKTFHKSNPRLEPGMVQAIARDHGKFVTIRVCFLDDAECPAYLLGGKDGGGATTWRGATLDTPKVAVATIPAILTSQLGPCCKFSVWVPDDGWRCEVHYPAIPQGEA